MSKPDSPPLIGSHPLPSIFYSPSPKGLAFCGANPHGNNFPCMLINETGFATFFDGLNIPSGDLSVGGNLKLPQGQLAFDHRLTLGSEGISMRGNTLTLEGGVLELKSTQIKIDGNPLSSPQELVESDLPRFSVYRSGAQPFQSILDEGKLQVAFDKVYYNTRNFFRNSSNVAVAPESGYYDLSCQVTTLEGQYKGKVGVTIQADGHKRTSYFGINNLYSREPYSIITHFKAWMNQGSNASCHYETLDDTANVLNLEVSGRDDESITYFEGEKRP